MPSTLYVTPESEVYFYANSASTSIRKAFSNGTVQTIAGDNGSGYSPDGILAIDAQLGSLGGIFVSSVTREVYFTETVAHVVRKIASNGTLVTVAGTANQFGYSGDGSLATNARLSVPDGVVIAASDNLYVSDQNNNCVRKVFANGTITTVASYFYIEGVAEVGQFEHLSLAVGVDEKELYIGDRSRCVVQKVTLENNTVVDVVGTGSCGYSGDNGLAINARIYQVSQLYVSPENELYIAEYRFWCKRIWWSWCACNYCHFGCRRCIGCKRKHWRCIVQ